ncbi:methyltransferase [Thiohalorhabdus sp. Cl-TMA]|uniref:Methyltransferase n=1 Tax=Thiohalorhabdus methylotrophus TaxID=3242694 RepID=A0ABV4TUC6_9GAMM
MHASEPPQTELAFTTNPGLEDLVAAEFRERLAAHDLEPTTLDHRPARFPGWVNLRHPAALETLLAPARAMRSVHHVLRPVAAFELEGDRPLELLEARLRELDFPELADAAPFRVTSERLGEHTFTSHDLQRVAGAVLVDRYAAPVDLKGYAVNIRVDVHGTRCAVAVQCTRKALSNRYRRADNPRVALRANVAYACLRLGAVGRDTRRILDPYCGSATVLLEAGELLPGAELYGGDWNARSVAGARRNLENAGLAGRARVEQADARHLAEHYPEGFFDAVVTNPPYGMRIGKDIQFFPFYAGLLRRTGTVLRAGGRLVVLVRKRGAFNEAVKQVGGLRIRHIQVVETSNLYPAIFVLEKQ